MIDTTFDIRSDAAGKDPDRYSPTLRRYHQFLYSKPLPSGVDFHLVDVFKQGEYLRHLSDLGCFYFSSDTFIPDYEKYLPVSSFLQELPEFYDFVRLGYTVGGTILFPSNRIGGKLTINGAKGFTRRIGDRMDLTLECIRRHYRVEPSPLGEVLERYSDFFALFGDFEGYVDFFLLQDMVETPSKVHFMTPFDDFQDSPIPQSAATMRAYMAKASEFLHDRNRRIRAWAEQHS